MTPWWVHALYWLALATALAGCASHGVRDVWSGPSSVDYFQRAHNACMAKAANEYVPFIVEMFGGHNARRTIYKDCMDKAGYFRVRTEDVPLGEGKTCGALQHLCKMELPVLEP